MKTLFVFEGAKREPAIFRTLESVFFKKTERIVCIYGTSFLDLYNRMRSTDFELDVVSVLKEKFQGREERGNANQAALSKRRYSCHRTGDCAGGVCF